MPTASLMRALSGTCKAQRIELGLDTRRMTLEEITFLGNYTYTDSDATIPGRDGDSPLPALDARSCANPQEEVAAASATETAPDRHRIVYLDIETQRGANDVGGWHNAHLMRVAVAVIYDELEARFETFEEADVPALLERLEAAGRVERLDADQPDLSRLGRAAVVVDRRRGERADAERDPDGGRLGLGRPGRGGRIRALFGQRDVSHRPVCIPIARGFSVFRVRDSVRPARRETAAK